MKTILLIALLISSVAQGYTEEELSFIKEEWGVDVQEESQNFSANESLNQNERERITSELEDPYRDYYLSAQRADRMVRAWVYLSSLLLKRKGYVFEAEKLLRDYQSNYSTFHTDNYFCGFPFGGLEDHDPYSLWLEAAYQLLVAIVGLPTIELLHLDDIHELNYSIPVALQPGGDRRVDPIEEWLEDEYTEITSLYFAGPITYWSIYIVCTGATYGIGIAFICSPVGSFSETMMAEHLAPPVARRVHRRAND